jgi:aryl-alcohol dehydrogenase-like predicted oxidoreductase
MLSAVEASLDRLDTDYVDLLWVHAWDGLTPVEEVVRGLDDLVARGLVHYVGISDAPAWVVADAQRLARERDRTPFAAVQLKYALTERTPERDLLPMARAMELGVLAWGPLDGGLLTGKYLDGEAGRLDAMDREIADREAEIAREVVAVAEERDASPAQVALAWVRAQPGQILPIVGARTPDQLADNLGSLDVRLDADHLARLDEHSAVDLGFPHEFLANPSIESVIFGGTKDSITPYAE